MKLWLISGASSSVGKSTLAKNLMRILPHVQTMKTGHGGKRADGPPNYFTDTKESLKFINSLKKETGHLLVESNRLAGTLDADIVIFLDSREGDRRSDANYLRSYADIIIGYRGNPDDWSKYLTRLDLSKRVSEKVMKVLQDHHEFLSRSRIKLKTKIWLGREGQVVFGEGLARLLDGIDRLGSLSKAAKEEGISYRHAWGDIKRAEERLGIPLLDRSIGGRSGGGSQLTGKARELLARYFALKRKAILESDIWFKELFKGIIDNI